MTGPELYELLRLCRERRGTGEVLASLAERAALELLERRGPGRCRVTGNACGTDTRPGGRPCLCESCQTWFRALEVE